jgi:membrane associated rhomboid family serine protease
MLADREYMRDRPFRVNWSASIVLMVALGIIFAIQCVNDVYVESFIERYLALTPFAFTRGYVWQFVTFQFLHVDLWHVLCNLLGLWFIGRFIENVLGTRRFLLAYFGAGVIGGLLQGLLMVLFPGRFAPWVLGASAGVMGVFAIFCRLEAGSDIRWNFILPIRAEVLLWITLGISLFFTLVPSPRGGGAAHAAHLGGLLAGMAFVKLRWHQDFRPLPWFEWWRSLRSRRGDPARVIPVRRGVFRRASTQRAPAAPAEDLPSEQFMSQEVDPILDKISQHGIQSLTEREKKILEAARAKMARR